jgi:hypothetical protein
MLKRLFVGLILGVLLGGIVGFALVQGIGLSFAGNGAPLSYFVAAVLGAITGLVAGKPIWAQDAKIEAGLKSFFGALLALGGMFAIRRWLNVQVDLTALKAGSGALGDLPVASLPLLAGVLSALFELDNTDEADKAEGEPKRVRVADSSKESDAEIDEEEEEEPAAKRKGR